MAEQDSEMTTEELIAAGQAFRDQSDQYSELITELADALEKATKTPRRRGRDYYDPARQNLISEHDCSFEDGFWWFGHGMPCKHPSLHSVEHAITYLRAIWMGLGEPTRNTPAGEVIAILRGERTATETQKEWAAEKDLVYQYRVQHPRYTEGLKDDFQWTRLLGIVQETAQEWGPEAWIERRLVGPIERVEEAPHDEE